jgi:hypothetical protein
MMSILSMSKEELKDEQIGRDGGECFYTDILAKSPYQQLNSSLAGGVVRCAARLSTRFPLSSAFKNQEGKKIGKRPNQHHSCLYQQAICLATLWRLKAPAHRQNGKRRRAASRAVRRISVCTTPLSNRMV